MTGTIQFEQKHYTTRQLAALVGVSDSRVLLCCSQGLVPGARRLALGWIIPQAGAEFIAHWLALKPQFGSAWLEVVAGAAAKQDRHCQDLQKSGKVRDGRKLLPLDKLVKALKMLEQGYTQSHVAEQLKCHYSAVSRIANNKQRRLGPQARDIIAKILRNRERDTRSRNTTRRTTRRKVSKSA